MVIDIGTLSLLASPEIDSISPDLYDDLVILTESVSGSEA